MIIQHEKDTLSVGDIPELGAANASAFRDQVRAALPKSVKAIEIDFSQTRFVDSCGLGALISLQKTAAGSYRGVVVRLLNPRPQVQQLLELTRMHRIFEIVNR